MTPDTPTPETDAARVTFAEAQVWPDCGGDYVDADVCARLERERDALRAAIVKHRDNFPDEPLSEEEELWAHVISIPNPDSSFQNPES